MWIWIFVGIVAVVLSFWTWVIVSEWRRMNAWWAAEQEYLAKRQDEQKRLWEDYVAAYRERMRDDQDK